MADDTDSVLWPSSKRRGRFCVARDEPGQHFVLQYEGSLPWLRPVPTRLAFDRRGLTVTLSRRIGSDRQLHVPAGELDCRLDVGAERDGEADLTLAIRHPTGGDLREVRLRVADLDLHVEARDLLYRMAHAIGRERYVVIHADTQLLRLELPPVDEARDEAGPYRRDRARGEVRQVPELAGAADHAARRAARSVSDHGRVRADQTERLAPTVPVLRWELGSSVLLSNELRTMGARKVAWLVGRALWKALLVAVAVGIVIGSCAAVGAGLLVALAEVTGTAVANWLSEQLLWVAIGGGGVPALLAFVIQLWTAAEPLLAAPHMVEIDWSARVLRRRSEGQRRDVPFSELRSVVLQQWLCFATDPTNERRADTNEYAELLLTWSDSAVCVLGRETIGKPKEEMEVLARSLAEALSLPCLVGPFPHDLHCVRSCGDELLAVGELGTAWRSSDDGHTWSTHPISLTDVNLWDTWAAGEHWWAVGSYGIIVHSADHGRSWSTQESPIGGFLSGITGTTPHDLWVVGAVGVILHSEDGGEHWSSEQSPIARSLHDLWGDGSGRLVAVGEEGTIVLRGDDGEWTLTEADTCTTLRAIAGTSDGELVVVGDEGTILCSLDQGHTWKALHSGTDMNLLAVCANDDGDFFAVGGWGSIRIGTAADQAWRPPHPSLLTERLGHEPRQTDERHSAKEPATEEPPAEQRPWTTVFQPSLSVLYGVCACRDGSPCAVGSHGVIRRSSKAV